MNDLSEWCRVFKEFLWKELSLEERYRIPIERCSFFIVWGENEHKTSMVPVKVLFSNSKIVESYKIVCTQSSYLAFLLPPVSEA
jgi:hypothetical protein